MSPWIESQEAEVLSAAKCCSACGASRLLRITHLMPRLREPRGNYAVLCQGCSESADIRTMVWARQQRSEEMVVGREPAPQDDYLPGRHPQEGGVAAGIGAVRFQTSATADDQALTAGEALKDLVVAVLADLDGPPVDAQIEIRLHLRSVAQDQRRRRRRRSP